MPSSESPLISSVSIGTIIEATGKTNGWYMVNLPSDKKGFIVCGYIQKDFVEEMIQSQSKQRKK